MIVIMAEKTTQTPATATAAAPAAPARSAPAVHSRPAVQVSQAELDSSLAAELEGFDDEPKGTKTKGATGRQRQSEPETDEDEADEVESEVDDGEDETADTEHEEDDESETETEGDEPDAEVDEEAPEDETDHVPKGMESWPLAARKRVQRQSASISQFKAALAQRPAFIADPSLPLAHCVTEADLASEIEDAKSEKQRLSALGDEDFTPNDKGEEVFSYREGGKTLTMTREKVAAKLASAIAKLDADNILAQQKFITARQTQKPWIMAEAIAPGMLEPGTPANKLYEGLVEACPEMKAKLTTHEVVVARAVRDWQREQEQAPTKEFPKGKYKWVRHEMDKAGNIVIPKRPGSVNTASTAGSRPTAPANHRPAARPAASAHQRTGTLAKAVERASSSRNEDSLRAVMLAEIGDW